MKIYFIYKKCEGLRPILYALTESKKYKDIFMNERKKDMFICIKKEIDDSAINDLKDINYKYFLDSRGYNTRPSAENFYRDNIHIVSTYNEEMRTYLSEESVIAELGKYTDDICKSFNKELTKALYKIEYFSVYKYSHKNDFYVNAVPEFSLEIDRLGLFLYLFGNTFNDKIM